MALVNAARPPSSGSFSRWTITTRLCAVVSALRQFHLTVQPSGTMILAEPFRWPLMSAEGAPVRLATSSVRVAVLPAESTASQSGAAGGAFALGEAGGGVEAGAAAASLTGAFWLRPAHAIAATAPPMAN